MRSPTAKLPRSRAACRRKTCLWYFILLFALERDAWMAEVFRVPVPAPGTLQSTWDTVQLFAVPRFEPAETGTLPRAHEIRAVFFDGEPFRGKPTRVFAWIGVPAVRNGKIPGVVLVHGGGGTAFRDWVALWMDRGYSAIAMDTCGTFLTSASTADVDRHRHERSGPPGWGGFERVDDPVGDQWMYHAVAAVIRGHSLLRSLPQVDPGRIGITGISWGGIITEIAAGVDDRFAFAAPIYGCGFLGENSLWREKQLQAIGRGSALRWLTLWDPSQYIGRAQVPMLFVNGTNDKHFRPDSWQKTYRTKPGQRSVVLKLRMPHGHAPAGDPREVVVFADSITRGGQPLPRIMAQGHEGGIAWARFSSSTPITKAELLYTKDRGEWMARHWDTQPATLDRRAGRAESHIPDGAAAWFLNLTDSRGCIISTEHEESDL